jgi:uncharacterized RDD family membrane protein YckC
MAAALDTVVSIETPEHIVFQYRLAGPARRAVAHLLDLVLCYLLVAILAVIVIFAVVGAGTLAGAAEAAAKAGIGLILVVLFLAQWCWFVAWEAIRGDTPGKRALGMRVVTTTGRPIGFVEAALRNVLRAADLLPTAYLVGVAAIAISPKFQRLGDLVAGTIVVTLDRSIAARLSAAGIALWPPPQPWELAAMPADVSLDHDERAALELFLRRRGTLGLAREHELASMIAARLAERHGWSGAIPDPVRVLALLYDRAANRGRAEAPPSTRMGSGGGRP